MILKNMIDEAYELIVLWRKNIFAIPTGSIGKRFILAMKKMVDSWNNGDDYSSFALKSLMVMPQLLLQKPIVNPNSMELTLISFLILWLQLKIY